MATDILMTFFSNTAVTANTNSDIMPMGATRQFGIGARPLYVDGICTVTFADSGDNSSATLTVQSSPYEAFNSSITNTNCWTIATNTASGTRVGPFVLPPLGADKAFLRVVTQNAGGDFSAGSISLWLTPDPYLYSPQPVGWTGPNLS
jgi:hypothetical protein